MPLTKPTAKSEKSVAVPVPPSPTDSIEPSEPAPKKPGRAAKSAPAVDDDSTSGTAAKRGRKAKSADKMVSADDADLSDIEAEIAGEEPIAETTEKVKPLRMKISQAKARALMNRRTHVTVDDVQQLAKPVLRHRILVNFAAESDGVTADDVVDRLLDSTPAQEDELVNDARFKAIFAS